MAIIMGPANGEEVQVISINHTVNEIDPELVVPDGWECFVIDNELLTEHQQPEPIRYHVFELYYNKSDKKLFYKTVRREPTKQERLEDLEEENTKLKMTIVDLYELILAGGASE